MSTTTMTENKTEEALASPQSTKLLTTTGVLDHFKQDDLTPVIGREFIDVNIVNDILNAPDSDQILRELALAVSQRGVIFFRKQDNLTDQLQKTFIQRLGEQSGKPSESTIHHHPMLNATNEFGTLDNEISTISTNAHKFINGHRERDRDARRGGAADWHSDIQFEAAPSDYTSLRITQLPPGGGGDTAWASGYEIYDRFSDPYRRFLEGLTVTFKGQGFLDTAAAYPDKFTIYEGPRGHPANVGRALTAAHPVVRTNPVTGWKSVNAIGPHLTFNELSAREGKALEADLYRIILDNHDLQVRFKWRNVNDIAIWDNRSVFHSATNDYVGDRSGNRAVGIGEIPYLDPTSKSRTEALQAAVVSKK